MELQTENGKKKVPLSTGLKWLRLVCMAVVFGIIAGGVMVGMNYLGGSMAAEEESIPQTSTVKVTAQAEDSDAVVAVAREAMPSVVTIGAPTGAGSAAREKNVKPSRVVLVVEENT